MTWVILLAVVAFFLLQIVKGFRSEAAEHSGIKVSISQHSAHGYPVEVVGESHYQDALEALCGGRTYDGVEKYCTASLVLEDSNPYDHNAVRVDISGRTVGYLSRDAAKAYRLRLKQSGRLGAVECPAVIRGGWDRGKNDKGSFGVRLEVEV